MVVRSGDGPAPSALVTSGFWEFVKPRSLYRRTSQSRHGLDFRSIATTERGAAVARTRQTQARTGFVARHFFGAVHQIAGYALPPVCQGFLHFRWLRRLWSRPAQGRKGLLTQIFGACHRPALPGLEARDAVRAIHRRPGHRATAQRMRIRHLARPVDRQARPAGIGILRSGHLRRRPRFRSRDPVGAGLIAAAHGQLAARRDTDRDLCGTHGQLGLAERPETVGAVVLHAGHGPACARLVAGHRRRAADVGSGYAHTAARMTRMHLLRAAGRNRIAKTSVVLRPQVLGTGDRPARARFDARDGRCPVHLRTRYRTASQGRADLDLLWFLVFARTLPPCRTGRRIRTAATLGLLLPVQAREFPRAAGFEIALAAHCRHQALHHRRRDLASLGKRPAPCLAELAHAIVTRPERALTGLRDFADRVKQPLRRFGDRPGPGSRHGYPLRRLHSLTAVIALCRIGPTRGKGAAPGALRGGGLGPPRPGSLNLGLHLRSGRYRSTRRRGPMGFRCRRPGRGHLSLSTLLLLGLLAPPFLRQRPAVQPAG